MPNVIKSQPEPQQKEIPVTNTPIERSVLDAGLTLKSIEFAQYLNLKEDMYNVDIMQKVIELTEGIDSVDDLMALDVKLGDHPTMTKLDKIYSYTQLLKQERELKRKQELLEKAKLNYIITNE